MPRLDASEVPAAAESSPDVDIVGIGFGPANLSLAIAIEERNDCLPHAERLRARFFEQQAGFGWHDGMLLPGATMQVSFLKDLVSQRNPTSPYSFLNYLHEHGRLTDFINLKTFFPLRRDYHAYLSWAAERVDADIVFGTTATMVERKGDRFVVSTRDSGGRRDDISTHAVVFGMGIRSFLPQGIVAGPRVFHNHNLLADLKALPSRPNRRFVVVGAGQSAAEVAAYLHENYPDAEVHASIRRFGYAASDDTPYANRIFDPGAVDEYYTAPPTLKESLLRAHRATNYAAVGSELIEDLYRREYEERVDGVRRLLVHRVTEVAELEETDHAVRVVLRDCGDRGEIVLEADAVVFATGFRAANPREMLGDGIDVDAAFTHDVPAVGRDYSLRLPGLESRIFLNGGVEHSHGLSSSLLSNLAVRGSEILVAATQSLPTYAGARP